MAKTALSVTLDDLNLVWLRGRARVKTGGNLSRALDEVITAARTAGTGLDGTARSAVGLVTLPDDDPDLAKADAAVRALFDESLARPLYAREPRERYGAGAAKATASRRRRRG
jgi:hypothetical protein